MLVVGVVVVGLDVVVEVGVDVDVVVDLGVDVDVVDVAQDARTIDVTMRHVSIIQINPLFIRTPFIFYVKSVKYFVCITISNIEI